MMVSRVVAALLVLSSLLLVRTQQSRLFSVLHASLSAEDVYYLPADTRVLQLLTLQYREASADLMWMKALLYYAEHLGNRSAAEYAMGYAGALVALDPEFTEPYRWAGSVPYYLSVQTPIEMKVAGTRLLVQGSDRFPNDGPLAWDAAATVTYELLPSLPRDSADRRTFEIESERLLARAVRLGAGPAWLVLNSASSSVRLGRTEVAIQNLQRALELSSDPQLREQLIARLSQLSASSRYLELEEAHRRVSQRRLEAFPYLDGAQFLVFGERRLPSGDDGP